jgi:regulator of sigma E protease
MNVLISAAAFLVAIGILVAVHEYGHFIAARLLGVRVLRFSIGFGRPLWIRQAGADRTEYCVSAIPFGGYVKLLDERDCAVSLAEQPRAFNRQPIRSRIIIMAAGPVLNFLFAIVAYWVMFMVGVPGTRPVVGEVESASIAAEAGLRDGDRILSVGGQPTATWEGVIVAMLDGMLGADRIELRVQDETAAERSVTLDTRGRATELTEPGRLFTGLGFEPWTPKLPAVIGEVLAGGAAERAGLGAGDRILSVDGEDIETWPEWVEFVRAHPGVTVAVQIERAGEPMQISVAVERAQAEEAPEREIGRIGASPRIPDGLFAQLRAVERYGPARAFTRSLERSWEMASLTVRMVARMHWRRVGEEHQRTDQYRAVCRLQRQHRCGTFPEFSRGSEHQPRHSQSAAGAHA